LGLERMSQKAFKLVKQGRVVKMDNDRYEVVGDHGIYTVARNNAGKLHCTCQGFQTRGRCSHVVAVMIYEAERRRRRKKDVEEKWWNMGEF